MTVIIIESGPFFFQFSYAVGDWSCKAKIRQNINAKILSSLHLTKAQEQTLVSIEDLLCDNAIVVESRTRRIVID